MIQYYFLYYFSLIISIKIQVLMKAGPAYPICSGDAWIWETYQLSHPDLSSSLIILALL